MIASPAPTRPCTIPSAMNGTRTNQFDAPTSFITSISRRRANVASRIVFTMRNSDDASRTSEITMKMQPHGVGDVDEALERLARRLDLVDTLLAS